MKTSEAATMVAGTIEMDDEAEATRPDMEASGIDPEDTVVDQPLFGRRSRRRNRRPSVSARVRVFLGSEPALRATTVR